MNIKLKESGSYSDFYKPSLKPIIIKDINNINNNEFEKLLSHYNQYGYAVFEIQQELSGEEVVLGIADRLELGDSYVPDYYRKNVSQFYNSNNLNKITESSSMHKGFHGTNEQKLHTDGTILPIGYIKTTILYCEMPALDGGESILFDAIGAFKQLEIDDHSAAGSLLDPTCLKRIIDIGIEGEHVGPAFVRDSDNDIITRFTIDNTAHWNEQVLHLDRALKFMEESAVIGSPFYIEFIMKKNQGIIFANDKISHGRKSYKNSKEQNRKMLRGLYLTRPSKSQ